MSYVVCSTSIKGWIAHVTIWLLDCSLSDSIIYPRCLQADFAGKKTEMSISTPEIPISLLVSLLSAFCHCNSALSYRYSFEVLNRKPLARSSVEILPWI